MIECRGRNGWFTLYEASASVFGDGQAAVRMASNKPYRDMPPIYFAGPKEEVQALLEKLLEEVKS